MAVVVVQWAFLLWVEKVRLAAMVAASASSTVAALKPKVSILQAFKHLQLVAAAAMVVNPWHFHPV